MLQSESNNSPTPQIQLDLLREGLQSGGKSSDLFHDKSSEIWDKANQSKKNTLFNEKSFPEILLIIDTETTGLVPGKDHCIEVGVILFSVSNRAILAQQSFLIPTSSNDAEVINKIPAEITKIKQPLTQALNYFESLVHCCDLIVAHNSEFDKKWFGISPLPEILKPWLCTMDDISWPKELNLKHHPSVRDLALAYGVPVWNAHRALTDCLYIAEVFIRCKNLEDLLIKGLEPKRLVKAEVSYEKRHLAKEAGFRWNDPIKGAWTRRISDRDASELPFNVKIIS